MWLKLILYVLVSKRRVNHTQMFPAPPAVRLFGCTFVCFLLVSLFILLPFIQSLKISKPQRQWQRVQWLYLVRYNSLYFLAILNKNDHTLRILETLKYDSQYLKIFPNSDAVLLILFKISLILKDKLNKYKFLCESWVS